MNEELAITSPANTEKADLAGLVSVENSEAVATGLSVEVGSANGSEARFYLTAMTHFFSGFSGDRTRDDARASRT